MSFKAWFLKAFTPDNTEEVRPGFYIQKKVYKDGTESFKQVHPVVWNDKISWKNFLFGPKFVSTTFWFLLLMILCFAYYHDTKEYRAYYEDTRQNLTEICVDWLEGSKERVQTVNTSMWIKFIVREEGGISE